tara:strand:+ start:4517 stop:4957 length:441 start_codon:yes stop_codon:yes gene_type:complete
MSGLTNINNMLDSDFDSWFEFELPNYTNKNEYTDKEDAIDCFKFCFEDQYKNGDRCLCGHTEDLCDTENLIEMSVYLADRYAQEDVIPDISIDTERNNGVNHSRQELMVEEIIHEYIFYYLKETKYQEFIQQIDNYWINNNLPPAQ